MLHNEKIVHFFISANTAEGFVSHFDELTDFDRVSKAYVIKSGPGTGKSTYLKKIAGVGAVLGENIELLHCSSDPSSLDGVFLKNRRITVFDGTPPHSYEPAHPGARERVIAFYDFLNSRELSKNADEIIKLFSKNKECYTMSYRYLNAAAALLEDNLRFSSATLDSVKLANFTKRLSLREIKKHKRVKGTENKRFLTAISENGISCFTETPASLCEKLYIVDDSYGAVSCFVMESLRKTALGHGYEIYSCFCPLAPYGTPEHVFIPELSLGFMTRNRFHNFEYPDAKIIRATRFYDNNMLSQRRQRLKFIIRTAEDLLGEASDCISRAHSIHNTIESYYIKNTDFSRLTAYGDGFISEISDSPEYTQPKKRE